MLLVIHYGDDDHYGINNKKVEVAETTFSDILFQP